MSREAAGVDTGAGGGDRPLSPEWRCLLTGTTPSLSGAELEGFGAALAHPGLDWARLTARACTHGVAPLFHQTLTRLALVGHLPPGARATLASIYYRNVARNTLLARMLRQVVQALQTRGIRVLVLKGAALAETVYPDPSVRPMSDLDLLVHPDAVAQAGEILRGLGYTGKDDSRRPKAWWLTQHYHLTFHPPATAPLPVPLEVHWHLERPGRPFAIDLEGLWTRAVPATLAGVETLVLTAEDLLLHLCLHLCKHAGAPWVGGRLDWRLRAFCDLAFVLHHHGAPLHWEALVQRAQAWGIASYAYLPLQLTRALWGVGLPEPVFGTLKPAAFDPRLVGWARDELLEEPETAPLSPDLLQLWRGHGVADRVAVVRRLLAPAVVARRYGVPPTSPGRYGYYPVRLWHLVHRYGPVLWRLVRHDPPSVAQAERKAQLAAWLRPFATRHLPPAPEG